MNNSREPGGTPLPAPEDFVTVARISKTQGRKGEVAAVLLTDFPELFASRKQLFARAARGQERRQLSLEAHWFHKGQVVFKFVGIDSIDTAEALIGCEIQVPRTERAALKSDTVYVSDLVGCAVYSSGNLLGTIEDVQFGAGEAPLLVVKGEKEYLVPFAGEYLEKVLLEQKRVEMKLPEGMLDLDAPLSQEEKRQQKQK